MTTKRKLPYIIVVNGRAGAPQPRARIEQIESLLNDFGVSADLVATTSDGELRQVLRRLVNDGAERVGVAGGDGTLAHAVEELAYTETAVAILPLGTFNNFAAGLNIPRDLHAALRLLWEGLVIEVDLGKVGAHYFTEAAGAGLTADYLAVYGTTGAKNPLRALYAASKVFLSHQGYDMRLVIDGEQLEARLSLCLIANSYRLGMAIPLAPGARMTDGRLNVVLVNSLTRREWGPYLRATWAQMLQTMPKARTLSASEVRLEAPAGMRVHCDDRLMLAAPIAVTAQSLALKVLVPRLSV